VDELTERLARAVQARADHGWQHAEAARAALDTVRSDGADPRFEHALAIVHSRFALGPAAADLLDVAVAAEQSVGLHVLFGLLAGDANPGRPTVALALELAGLPADGRTAHEHFGELSPLRRFGLVQLSGTDVLLSRRVVVTARVLAFLAGDDLPPRFVLAMLLDGVPVELDGTELVVRALQADHRLVWVHAPGGGAGAAMATAACRRLDVPCLIADLARLDPAVTVEDAVTALLLECGLAGMVLVLVGAERARVDGFSTAAVPVLAVSAEPWDPQWSSDLPLTVPAPRLSVAEREQLWTPILGDGAALGDVIGMPLSPEQIVTVGRHAAQTAHLHGEDGVSPERVRHSARELSRGRAVRANAGSSATLDDLVLSGTALSEVKRLLDWARYRSEIVAMGPLHGKGGKGIGICALFSGPPGTGKTLAAHVIADSLGMDLYQVDLSSIVDKYIGETEKNLERVFAEAEATNAVLFFDEADALFGSRSEVRDAKDRYANQEIAYLLQRMEQFDGITVLASNLRGNIDTAFARRLHFMVTFPDPDEATRRRLWEHHLEDIPGDPADPVDLDWLAGSVELAGGDIRNIVLSAAYAAVAEGSAIGMRHTADAVRREYIKLGRRPPVAQRS
jgi:predicted nucleic acid-binding protein